ncbi:hypothetical protein BTO18_13160 [Polaribacter porphyrae]|uniref:Tryptophan-rich sensory protein n=2 Tax=Polaribacter porphyrae TaxID=1137780 RepID=A0A2S7WR40_9FLAO|nr:hypothetical protein BTO18_13160 [Polaribacter porphyrae]
MKKALQILNGIAFVSTVFINYLSNTGAMNNRTIGSLSDSIRSLFTPAGYAFSIWGLIYLFLFGFVIYQGRSLFLKVKNDDFVEKVGFWFIISCVANSAWVFAWIYEYTGISCIFIFLLLASILKIIINNKMQIQAVKTSKLLLISLPFVIYGGWVTVASVANVSSYLVKINWEGFGVSAEIWTIIMIVIATLINLMMLSKRKLYAFALAGAWALTAIGVANKENYSTVSTVALGAAVLLVLATLIIKIKNSTSKNTST